MDDVTPILIPIRKKKKEELSEGADLFNRNLGAVRGVVERSFLLKNKFKVISKVILLEFVLTTEIEIFKTLWVPI